MNRLRRVAIQIAYNVVLFFTGVVAFFEFAQAVSIGVPVSQSRGKILLIGAVSYGLLILLLLRWVG